MDEAICDTSPLQYLFQVGLLDLLPFLYSQIIVPEAVVSELTESLENGVALPRVDALPWIRVKQPRERSFLPMVAELGPGEREVLGLAQESPEAVVILDDGPARRWAKLLRVKAVGTIGILLIAKRRGRLSAIAPVLDKLDALRFRLDATTRKQALIIAGEIPSK